MADAPKGKGKAPIKTGWRTERRTGRNADFPLPPCFTIVEIAHVLSGETKMETETETVTVTVTDTETKQSTMDPNPAPR